MKGTCVSTALFMQHVAMGIFGGDFGFVNVVSGHVSPFKQGFDFDPYEIPNPIPNPVPEPATMLLLGSGLLGLAGFRKKFKR